MARRPAGDERLVVAECSVAEWGRRVWVKELIRYLAPHPAVRIYRFLRQRRLLHRAYVGTGYPSQPWITEEAALRVIAWCRAREGDVYLQGKDWRVVMARKRARRQRVHARQMARRRLASSEERDDGE